MIPFLKWAGGKRWLFTDSFVASLPRFERYIEPFVGGGSAFFATKPSNAVISDINAELINLYCVMRDFPFDLFEELFKHSKLHSEEYYYHIRNNIPKAPIERAGRMLYLNRSCWNGLYRLNKNGIFNVPKGTKDKIILDSDRFDKYSQVLRSADILCQDFEETLSIARKGDLVFIDPPYTVKHNMNGFVKYNEKIFSWEDQIRLRDCSKKALERGAKIVLTNANHESIRELYADIGRHIVAERASVISGKREGRANITELMVIA